MTSWQIRDAEAPDADTLRAIFRNASLSNDGDRAALLANPAFLVWDEATMATGRVRVVTGADGVVAGFATTRIRDVVAELEDLFVDPRQMRRGVGVALIGDAVSIARASGCMSLTVTANPHAASFYAAAGFTGDAEIETELGAGTRLTVAIDR